MTDKEKVLRWNLQAAHEERERPLPDCFPVSGLFGLIDEREKLVRECEKELRDFLSGKTLEKVQKE